MKITDNGWSPRRKKQKLPAAKVAELQEEMDSEDEMDETDELIDSLQQLPENFKLDTVRPILEHTHTPESGGKRKVHSSMRFYSQDIPVNLRLYNPDYVKRRLALRTAPVAKVGTLLAEIMTVPQFCKFVVTQYGRSSGAPIAGKWVLDTETVEPCIKLRLRTPSNDVSDDSPAKWLPKTVATKLRAIYASRLADRTIYAPFVLNLYGQQFMCSSYSITYSDRFSHDTVLEGLTLSPLTEVVIKGSGR